MTPLASVDTLMARLKQSAAIVAALRTPYTMQEADKTRHRLTPLPMADALWALDELLDQALAAATALWDEVSARSVPR